VSYEDYTTYDEVDENNNITVATNQLTIVDIRRDAEGSVTDDKGAAHFGDFEHLVDGRLVTSENRGTGTIWGLSNGYFGHTDQLANLDGFALPILLRNNECTR
jgi:hypothetical protein